MAKKTIIPVNLHRDCKFSDIHHWPGNPLIVRCLRSGERWPASMGGRCPLFRKREQPEVIIEHQYGETYDWTLPDHQ